MAIPDSATAPRCYAHPDRVAGSVCRRCGRPICPECMREAPVGWQCDSCVRGDARRSPAARWRPGRRGAAFGRLGRTRITPVVIAIIALNVVVYLYESRHPAFEEKYWLVPFEVRYWHRWYQLFTSAFLHENSTHILLNMITLAIVGPAVEAEVGRIRFVVVYLLSAVGGSVGFYLLAPANSPGLGASGAIFGLMGAYYVLARMRRWEIQTITVLLVINLAYSFTPNVGWQDHLGGLLTGAAACAGLMWGTPSGVSPRSEVSHVVQGAAAVIAVFVVLALLMQLPPGHINA